jgi:hypothetical protein
MTQQVIASFVKLICSHAHSHEVLTSRSGPEYPNPPMTWKVQLAAHVDDHNKWWSVDHLGTVRYGRIGTGGPGTTAKRRLSLEESGKKILQKLKKGYLSDSLVLNGAHILNTRVLRLLLTKRRITVTPISERGDWIDQVRWASFGATQGHFIKSSPFPWVVLSDSGGKVLTSCSLYDLGVNFRPILVSQ